jgi:hypothetical protein
VIGDGTSYIVSTILQKPPEAEKEVKMTARCILFAGLLLASSLSSANADETPRLDVLGPLHFQVAQATGEPASGGQTAAPEGGGTFTDMDEAARQSSNPLGGDFMIILNQIDNYFM